MNKRTKKVLDRHLKTILILGSILLGFGTYIWLGVVYPWFFPLTAVAAISVCLLGMVYALIYSMLEESEHD